MKKIFKLLLLILFFTINLFANQKVSLQLPWKYQFEFAGFITALEKGYYKDVGLDVEIKEYSNGTDTVSDVINLTSTFGIYNGSLIMERVEGKPVVLLGSYLKHSPLIIVTTPDIKNPNDLKNKTIMINKHELKHGSIALLFKHFNLISKVKQVDPSFDIEDFISGKVDAVSAFSTNELYYLNKKNIRYNVLDPVDYGFYSTAVNLFTSSTQEKNNPKQTQDFIDASNKGWRYALTHKQEIVNLIYDKYSKKKSKEALIYEANKIESLMMIETNKVGSIDKALLQRTARQYVSYAMMPKSYKLDNFLFNDKFGYENKIDYKYFLQVLSFFIILFLILILIIFKISKDKQYLEIKNILIQQSKMVSMGEMVANIAHQWRQPLNALGLMIQKTDALYKKDRLTKDDIKHLSTKGMILINQMSNTINYFQDFLKTQKEKELFSLTHSIEKALIIVDAILVKENIKVVLDLDDSISINSFENGFLQAFVNIINNAKDALEQNNKNIEKYIFIKTFQKTNTIFIIIKDNANGIPINLIDKIFEPYFTTKENDKGTGLGLYMTKQIITDSIDGVLSVKNEEFKYNDKIYKGASFMIKSRVK